MQTICIILIAASLFFIYISIKGLRHEADTISYLHQRQYLGFNSEPELKEAQKAVNYYIMLLLFMGLVDIICIKAFLS